MSSFRSASDLTKATEAPAAVSGNAPEATKRCVVGVHNGHNSSAAIVEDGRLVFALQEERLTRLKNQGGLPRQALQHLRERLLRKGEDFSAIPLAFGGRNMTACYWRRHDILRAYGRSRPSLSVRLKTAARRNRYLSDLINRQKMETLRRDLAFALGALPASVLGLDHHLCHAASAYFGWGRMDEKILLLTCDGAGDSICASVNIGHQGVIQRIAQVEETHSIGTLYAKVTYLMGMVPMEHEYKLMGLAPYAEASKQACAVADRLESLFEFDARNPMVWRRRTGCPPLQYASDFLAGLLRCRRFDYVAGGVQIFLERFLLRWIRACVRETRIGKVGLSGGVFMNVKANQRILELPEIEELFVFPSCGDETNAIGAGWLHGYMESRKAPQPLANLYLGPEYSDGEVEEALRAYAFRGRVRLSEAEDIEKRVAELLSEGKIVARHKGRAEFGARALGNRSILASAAQFEAVRIINDMIKCRDFWMPFAPSVLAERSEDYFIKPRPIKAPYMILTFDTRPEKRSAVIAAMHPYDYTVRPHEVFEEANPDYYRLLKYFEEITGEGIVLNTSFNLHGEPMVCSPADALRVFDLSALRYLALGRFLLSKC